MGDAGLRLHKEETWFSMNIVGLTAGLGGDGRYRTMVKPEGLGMLCLRTLGLPDKDGQGHHVWVQGESILGH